MPATPWKSWVPGALSKRQIRDLLSEGYLTDVNDPDSAIDQSAIDLHLSDEAYKLTKGSVKPWGERYLHQISTDGLIERIQPQEGGVFLLRRRETYLFKIRERLPYLANSRIYGQATAKSSIGRMDILARLVVDGMNGYEYFDSERGLSGDIFVEITPMTFNVRVKPGTALTQLRLFYGNPENLKIVGPEICETCLGNGNRSELLHACLESVTIGGAPVSAFSADENPVPEEILDLWDKPDNEKPEPWKFFKFLEVTPGGRLELKPEAFYIFRSREQIALPKGVCVYCRAIDETIGEMRIHYAGFVHPLFGINRTDRRRGTPLIFEVRGHDVPVSLKDGEQMARLIFYRMSEDAEGETDSSPYGMQTLQLSKYFRKWPDRVTVDPEGHVRP